MGHKYGCYADTMTQKERSFLMKLVREVTTADERKAAHAHGNAESGWFFEADQLYPLNDNSVCCKRSAKLEGWSEFLKYRHPKQYQILQEQY